MSVLVLRSFFVLDVFAFFLLADKYSVGQRQEISLEIKPTSHTGLLLSSWNAKGDYIVLEMSNGNVSNVLGRCDAFNFNWSKLWCKVNPSKVGSLYISGKLPTYPSPYLTLILTSHLGQNDDLGEG